MQEIEVIESDFEAFDPKEYLREYYLSVDYENEQLLRFYTNCYQNIDSRSTLLEFGSGPTLYSLIAAAAKVDAIHVSDRLESNLREIQSWQREDKAAFNWDLFIHRTLELEGSNAVTRADLWKRASLLRRKLVNYYSCDAFNRPPLQGNQIHTYDIVQVNFVAESITSSLAEWEEALQNILSLLKPRGTLILTALKYAEYYQVQEKNFPAVSIDETILIGTLNKFGLSADSGLMQTIPASLPERGYGGIMMVKAHSYR